MSKEAEKLAKVLAIQSAAQRNPYSVAKQSADLIRRQAEQIRELRQALEIAREFMGIASDWNIDEAEINGEMRSTYDWIEVLDAALSNTKEET